tara:strand:+ start:129 stop:320 length:192 start_codon:yes stop_codon:yes gene_type:complete
MMGYTENAYPVFDGVLKRTVILGACGLENAYPVFNGVLKQWTARGHFLMRTLTPCSMGCCKYE